MKAHEKTTVEIAGEANDTAHVAGTTARPSSKTRLYEISLLLAGSALLLWSSISHAADTLDWPHRTATERGTITTVIDTHETVMLLDLLRQGKRQKAADVLFAMLDLRLMEINAPGPSFSPGEWKELCHQMEPLGKLEKSRMFHSLSFRDPKQASHLRSEIATLRKSCASR